MIHSKMDELPGAKLKHALRGITVGMYAACGDEMNNCSFESKPKSPCSGVKMGNCKGEQAFYDKCWDLFFKFADCISYQIENGLPEILERVSRLPP